MPVTTEVIGTVTTESSKITPPPANITYTSRPAKNVIYTLTPKQPSKR